MGRLALALLLLLAGCAGPAAFAPAVSYWGFQTSVVNASSVETFTWGPSLPVCDLLRAAAIARDDAAKNTRAGSYVNEEHSPCRSVTVTAGGPFWGFTSGALAGVGQATTDKLLCELLRAQAQQPSQCSPVTVR